MFRFPLPSLTREGGSVGQSGKKKKKNEHMTAY